MITDCPSPERLVAASRARGPVDHADAEHIATCPVCRDTVRELRAIAASMHAMPAGTRTADCLDDNAIAIIAEGNASALSPAAIAHLGSCAHCRARVVAITNLTADPEISAAIAALDSTSESNPRKPWMRGRILLPAGLVAAAAAAIVFIVPIRSALDPTPADTISREREAAITTSAAPRILSAQELAPAESLRWSPVPQADLYLVRVWDEEGAVIWSGETRSTALVLPSQVEPGTSYLWDVRARTGWDRWVSSGLASLAVRGDSAR